MNLAQRSVTSVAWNMGANWAGAVVLFVRSALLARWLPVEVFGIYAFAQSVMVLSSIAANLGVGSAFLHRSPETEDEELAAAVHFTLKCLLTVVWAALLVTGTFIFAEGQMRTALLLLTATTGLGQLTHTPREILVRRVVHRRLAVVGFLDTCLTTLVALGLAWQGVTLWALLAVDLAGLILSIVTLYVWRPVWRPRLTWSPRVMRYFLRFGSRVMLASLLLRALDRIDDLWTGLSLGETSLGFYSRAYTFATYPRRVLASSINAVAGGAYAELKGNRLGLSKVFFRTNALMVRSGFLLAGLLTLIAPEFIRLVLSPKWLPMLDAFRLMLVFTLFDPIRSTVSDLFVAVGKPGQIVRARLVQLAVLIGGLCLLGPRLGITGVALAVDTMLVTGIAILLWQARVHVNFSLGSLFVVPILGLVAGLLLVGAILRLPGVVGSDWWTGLVKAVTFTVVYSIVLLTLERRQLSEMLLLVISRVFGKNGQQNVVGLKT